MKRSAVRLLRTGLAVALVASLAFACATAKPYNPSGDDLCDGLRAKQKLTFFVSSSSFVPPGLPVQQVGSLITWTSTLAKWIAPNLPLRLSSTRVAANESSNGRLNAMLDQVYLVRTGTSPLSFVVCHQDQCNGLVDPVSKAVIKEFAKCPQWTDYRPINECEVPRAPSEPLLFEVKGVAPNWSNFSELNAKGSDNDLYLPVLRATAVQTGMQPGAYAGLFSGARYLSVPEANRARLCREGGERDTCLDLPSKARFYSALTEYRSLLSQGKTSLETFEMRVARVLCTGPEALFDSDDGANCGFPIDFQSEATKTRWTNIAATLLFFDIGTKTNRRTDKDWTITQVTFDPTNFCRYARPESDFVTQ